MIKTFRFNNEDALDHVLDSFEEFLTDNGYSFEGNLYIVDTSEFEDDEEDVV
jgi:hypothetical protein